MSDTQGSALPTLHDYPEVPFSLPNTAEEMRVMQLTCVWRITPEVEARAKTIREYLRATFPANEVTAAALLTIGSITYQEIAQLKRAMEATESAQVH